MPNVNTANFTLTGMTAKRSLGTRLSDRFLTVKDFGATGNGSTDDSGAIQLAFNTLYGTAAAPQGPTGSPLTSKTLYFPAGQYKISQPLVLNNSYGATLLGAGSPQTRLFWSGPRVDGEPQYEGGSPVGAPISSLIEAKSSYHQSIEGITLDASGVQDVVLRLMRFNSSLSSSGTDGYYRDVVFTNAIDGVLGWGEMLASERTYVGCSFTNCKWGVRLTQANALNHCFYNCYFANNESGYDQQVGGCGIFMGCSFENNSVIDIHHKQSTVKVVNCHSTSKNFASCDGSIVGCRHVSATAGFFYTNNIGIIPGDVGSGGWRTGTDQLGINIIGNYSSNGTLIVPAAPMILTGNLFSNAGYLTGVTTPIRFKDGTAIP